jgi:hypothetical protein
VASARSLQDELDDLRNHDVSAWLEVIRAEASEVRSYERSISWRVTRPLRMAGMFRRSVRDIGIGATMDRVFAFIARKVRRS